MQEPINYLPPALDPFTAGLAGFQQGQQTRGNEQAMRQQADAAARDAQAFGMDMQRNQQIYDQSATQFGQQNMLFDQGQQDRLVKQQQAQAEQAAMLAEQQRYQAASQVLVEKARLGTLSSADTLEFNMQFPDHEAAIKSNFDGLSEERRRNDALALGQAAMALKAGKPNVVIQMLKDRAEAARNSGNVQDADMAEAMIDAVELSPEAGQVMIAMALQGLDPDMAKVVFGDGDAALPADVQTLQWRAEQAGLVPGTPDYEAFIRADGKTPAQPGTTTVNADGSIVVARATGTENLTDSVLSVESLTSSIDDIMNDPALGKVTGAIEGGGGNDIGEFGMGRRVYYGDDGLALIEKIGQLQNTTFLAARQMLKGGGAITDFESKKAEAAMSRLNRAKSEAEYKEALKDLRDAITDGAAKLAGATSPGATGASPAVAPAPAAAPSDIDALLRQYGGP